MTPPDPVRDDDTLWSDPAARRSGSLLAIDLGAVQDNYRLLRGRLRPGAACGAAIKADGYGLGAAKVGPALAAAGCETFFVAHLDEGIALRAILASSLRPSADIYILNGLMPGCEADYLGHRLYPVLNDLAQVSAWSARAAQDGNELPAALHIDSGMNRLGLPAEELETLAEEPSRLQGITPLLLMTHLACAEDAEDPMNEAQRLYFEAACARLPAARISLANSSGIFLGPDYHHDLARPGASLYGVNPTPREANPMRQVVSLKAKILQVRSIDAPQSVGYGASHRVAGPTRLATLGVGYADGYLRSLSNRGSAFIGGREVAVVGRVSMDLITLDVSAVPPELAQPGATVDLLDPDEGVDRLGREAGTIGYEILTALGRRYHRAYIEPSASAA